MPTIYLKIYKYYGKNINDHIDNYNINFNIKIIGLQNV